MAPLGRFKPLLRPLSLFWMLGLILAPFPLARASMLTSQGTGSPCYEMDSEGMEDLNKPQKCMPAFENVVHRKNVGVAPEQMTCGRRSKTEYCIQTHGIYRECDYCLDSEPDRRHPSNFLTDIHEDFNHTWWQSVTMLEDVHTQNVNLTVNLGKSYEITYVRLKFHSPRPATFAIYKKNRRNPATPDLDPDSGWIPWQYYSATCRDTFQMPDATSVIQPKDGKTKVNEDRALCTSTYSDLTPLTGGNVAFSTLEGRPSGYNFEYSPELQEWVTATDIRISLKRLNTFGDEVFGDPKVLRSYYYAITDFTVGGRCQCHGHATHCVNSTSNNLETTSVCLCQHGTDGSNCETCLQDHWDVPWRSATSQSANECKPCECNGWSNRCRFNEQLYQERGRGGECLECEGNRDGPNCERCKPNHFFSPIQDALGRTPCEACNCDPTGSRNLQCSPEGQCECKPGVTGPKCDQCEANYWNFGSLGCQFCDCYPDGSLANRPDCDTSTGNCHCKQNVEGQRCDRCKAGHFHIDETNEFGCTPCFCYGHTSECDLSGGFTQVMVRSDFSRSSEDWASREDQQDLPLKYDGINKYIGVQSSGYSSGSAYFLAPPEYRGDQRASYNQELKFKLRINDVGPRPNIEDVIIEGGGAKTTRISLSITDQTNPTPNYEMQDYTFKLHENPEFGWSPRLSSKDYMAILANITGIMIRGTYVNQGVGFLDEVRLGSAERGGSGPPATWIERCNCPAGYQGQFCQLCQQGFHHNSGGPFARCIPCSCNGHADVCDAETGECACRDNTAGHNCERCSKGFYGNALNGNSDDCQPCPCPDGGACMEIYGNPESPICIECPTGRRGPRCELCEDGYFGDPMGRLGTVRPCQKCDCNNNVDSNAIGNCNSTTGECLRCIDNTDGFNCERCKSGFFGDALALKKPGDPPSCQPCQCYPVGTNLNEETYLPICNGYTGDCSCKSHVVGRDCDQCADGFFNLDSGEGCEPCNCDSIGSFNASCHVQTGQCNCRDGVTGPRCDMCLSLHFGFSQDGCQACECDSTGSTDLQCDLINGQCPCRDKVEGRQCDRCMENTRTRDTGGFGRKICEPCDDCYNLVQDATDEHRRNLAALDGLLQQIAENPEPVGGDFEYQLRQLQVRVKSTLADARINSQNEAGGTLRDRLEDLRVKLTEVIRLIMEADTQVEDAKNQGSEAQRDMSMAKDIVERARESLKAAQRQLDTQGREALRRAQERSKKFGEESQKMTAIAREARTLAEQQVEDANEISSIAKQAYDKSTDAYNMARDALEQQHRTANQITVLEVQIGDMGEKLRTVQSLAAQTFRDSTEAYNEALNIYQQANSLEIPEVDNELLESQTIRVSKEARRIQDEAARLLAENGDLLMEAQDRRVQLEDLLRRAEAQQQQIDDQLAQIDGHRTRSLDAVKTGNNVLKDAQSTLKTLKEFESQVAANEETARAAMDNIDDIESMIVDAEGKTVQARNAMVGADTSAKLALTVASDAQKIAGEASTRAANISSESGTTLEQAAGLADSARSLADKLADTKEIVMSKEGIATEDEAAAIQALSKANVAQQKAASATKKLAQAKKELEDISAILSTVEEPEPGLLEELARRVEEAERLFKAEDLDQRLKDLVAAKQRQTARVRDMERELDYLREESTSIEAIRDSLPNFCPKSNELCLEDQC